jgi:hypothetical protein
LKADANKIFTEYTAINETLINSFKETTALLIEKIKDSGVVAVEQGQNPKELVSTFKHNFD